jgi:hypothetical protein
MFVLVAVLAICSLALVGCGSSSSSSSASATGKSHLATAKFVLHAGLAFGAFHRWIYKPFKAGAFTGGNLKNHKAAAVKAALAGLFAYHEAKLAVEAAKASPSLSKVTTALAALGTKLKSIATGLKSGTVDPSAIESASGAAGTIGSLANGAGAAISDKQPSTAQLLSGG